MKKLILFLFISLGIKAQVVVPKSTTTFSNVRATGSMTVANKLRVGSTTAPSATLDVTGTMSVSSTATITGAAKQTNTLNYEGNTTWNTNQTNTLTTGNTGTVAVLSDVAFPITFNTENFNPVDATTYYYGNALYANSTTASNGTITIPYNCTLVSWQYNSVTTGGAGTAESSTLAINGTTNYTLSTSITYSAAGLYNGQSGSGLSQNFAANDVLNIKLVTPTWATNPTGMRSGLTLWFVRRQ